MSKKKKRLYLLESIKRTTVGISLTKYYSVLFFMKDIQSLNDSDCHII